MLKSIFKQILNRKRSNAWITVELLMVFILVWYMTDYFFVLNYNYNIPNGRSTEHTWEVKLAEYPEIHPQYSAEANTDEALEANFARILQTIRNYPGVEAVSVSDRSSAPESGSYSTGSYFSPEDSTNHASGQMIYIDTKEDFFRVFGYTTNNGKTPVSVADFDWTNPRGIVVGRSVADRLFPNTSAIGKELNDNLVIIGIVDNIKRFASQRPQHAYYFPLRSKGNSVKYGAISIRSNSSLSDASFQEAFTTEMSNRLQTGNFYLKNMVSYSKLAKKGVMQSIMTNVSRQVSSLMIFFLLNILLCVMGTFWYRIQMRRDEIGLRKALGATCNGIRNALLAEGLCLLTIALIPALLIEFQIVHADMNITIGRTNETVGLYLPDRAALRFLITNGVTWMVMAAVIVAAIWLPARKAAALPAAEALHYE
jgi:ABC-type antimicrobial peptide transport system permease subunit